MFKMSAFSVKTGWQTMPPLVDGVVHNRLVQFAPQVGCAHKSGDVINFIIVACRISSRLKWYKNYKNRLRLAKVIIKNKMSRFYGSVCTFDGYTLHNCWAQCIDKKESSSVKLKVFRHMSGDLISRWHWKQTNHLLLQSGNERKK